MDTLLFSSICLLLVTLISYLGNFNALFDLISHFRVHFLLAAGVLMPFAILHPNKTIAIIVALSVIINSYEVLPWHIKNKKNGKGNSEPSISITSINVQFNNQNPQKIVDFLLKKNSDVLFLQELNKKWIGIIAPLIELYQYHVIEDPGNQFGIGILSKFEITKSDVLWDDEFRTPSLIAEIKVKEKTIKLITIHPVPPFDTAMLKSRNRVFNQVAEMARQSLAPIVVGGDFNVTMWAPAYKQFEKKSGLKNFRIGFGINGTWPFNKPNHKSSEAEKKKKIIDFIPSFAVHKHPIKLPIDHLLVSREIMVKNMSVGPSIGSDHLPIHVEIQILKT